MVKKKAPVKSRKPLAGEALYQKLMGDAFTSITMNESRLIQEDWLVVNQQEEAMLHAMVTAPTLNEPQQVKDSMIVAARTKLADVYHRSGLEGDLVAGFSRANTFVKKAEAAIGRINGTKTDIGRGGH